MIGQTLEKTTKQQTIGMTKTKIIILLFNFLISMAFASIGVPSDVELINQSNDILVGSFETDEYGNVYFRVEQTLKGELVLAAKILINEKSNLAWPLLLGGGVRQPKSEEFIKLIQQKKWFNLRVVILGDFKNGLWKSNHFDWSIWPYNNFEMKASSVGDVINFVENVLKQKSNARAKQ